MLSQAKEKLSIPIIAIGGINAENVQAVIDAGVDLVAVINYLFKDRNVKMHAGLLTNLLADLFTVYKCLPKRPL